MPAHLRPIRTTYFEGLVYDINTKAPLSGKFYLYDLKTGKEVVRSQADPVTGEFLVSLPENASYALSVEMDGYLNYSKNFDLKLKEGEEAFRMNIPMIPITNTEPIVLENIFFDLNKADLLPESQVELNKLNEFLVKNPKIKIEISGHTDSRGDDKLNQDLSQRRADAVVNYLVTKGIDKSRLSAKGYGASQPRVTKSQIDAMTSNEEKEKAHQANRRTEYKIVKY
jgi:outer membrane protein OmpA-like peptidoglycan-associated protein